MNLKIKMAVLDKAIAIQLVEAINIPDSPELNFFFDDEKEEIEKTLWLNDIIINNEKTLFTVDFSRRSSRDEFIRKFIENITNCLKENNYQIGDIVKIPDGLNNKIKKVKILGMLPANETEKNYIVKSIRKSNNNEPYFISPNQIIEHNIVVAKKINGEYVKNIKNDSIVEIEWLDLN